MKANFKKVLNVLESKWWLVICTAMFATFVLILFLGKGQDVWFDEGYSIIVAKKPVAELLSLTGVDAHPPFFYLLLKAWGSAFGWSEFSLRSLSAFFASGTIGAMFLLVRSLFSNRVAILIIPFVVIAPFLLRYGYEIRMYALMSFIAVLSTFVLARAIQLRTNWKYWVLYAFLVATGMYTLYMSVIIWIAHLIWCIKVVNYKKKPIYKEPFFIAYLGAFVLFLPHVPTLISQSLHSALPPMDTLTLYKLVDIFGLLFFYSSGSSLGAWQSLLLLLVLIVITIAYYRSWRVSRLKERNALMLMSLPLIVGVLLYAISSLPPLAPRFNVRYMAHISAFLYALIGLVLVINWRAGYKTFALISSTLILAVCIYGTFNLNLVGNYNFQRSQENSGKNIVQFYGCEDTVYISDGPYIYIDMYYELYKCDHRLYSNSDPAFHGGYAPLHGFKRQFTTTDLSANRIILVRYDKTSNMLIPDERYRMIQDVELDKTYLNVYELQR